MSLRTESDYYAYRDFDRANADAVLGYYVDRFPAGPVLELACGPGVFLSLLRDAGVATVGVDIDPGMVEEAAKEGHQVVLADAVEYLKGAEDESFEGVFGAHFLEHLPAETAQQVFNETKRVLKPGGVAVFVVPSAQCYSVLTVDFWRDPTHVRFYDPLCLGFFAEQAGLEVVEFGGNATNHPGAPPEVRLAERAVVSALRTEINVTVDRLISSAWDLEHDHRAAAAAAVTRQRRMVDRVIGSLPEPELSQSWAGAMAEQLNGLRALMIALDDNVQTLQHELGQQNEAYNALLDQMYAPNEVFLQARKPN